MSKPQPQSASARRQAREKYEAAAKELAEAEAEMKKQGWAVEDFDEPEPVDDDDEMDLAELAKFYGDDVVDAWIADDTGADFFTFIDQNGVLPVPPPPLTLPEEP